MQASLLVSKYTNVVPLPSEIRIQRLRSGMRGSKNEGIIVRFESQYTALSTSPTLFSFTRYDLGSSTVPMSDPSIYISLPIPRIYTTLCKLD